MSRRPLFVLAFACLWLTPVATGSDDQRMQSDLEEAIQARLFVVPMRIETTSDAKRGECAALGPEDLTVSIRGKILKDKTYLQSIEDGLVTLDRRPRPMLHALVFDTSGSMSMDLPDAKAAALAYVDTTLGELDKSMIVGFDDAVTLWQRATHDREKLKNAIERVEVAGQTSLFDALVNTIRELDAYRERPVVVVVSDGSDNASFYDAGDVIDELKRRPDLVIFAIGIGQRSTGVREMLRRVTNTTSGRYFDVDSGDELAAAFAEIRDVLGTEAVLSVVDPDPTNESNRIEVRSFNADCAVTVLGRMAEITEQATAREPIPIPPPALPTSYHRPLSRSHEKILARGTLLRDADSCYDRDRTTESRLSQWEFDVDLWSVTGCAPDIALSHGFLYQPGSQPFVGRNEEIQVKIRPFAVEIPRFEALSDDPASLLDALLATLPEDFSYGDESTLSRDMAVKQFSAIPQLLHGTTFLEMRPRIARAFMSQPGYGEWALARLETWIEADIDLLEARYRKLFPDLSSDAIRLASRNSDDAKAMRARLTAPTEVDLQPFLSAWLGDIESHALFDAWEHRAINRWLGRDLTDQAFTVFVEGWRKLRDLLSVPSNLRVVAPLIPMYETECDCVGFYRIILPRPSLMRERTREHSVFMQGPRLDVAPRLPFGVALLHALTRQVPEVGEQLRAGGYRLLSVDYELLGPSEFHDPVRAFRETRVRLEFAAPSGSDREQRSATISADLHRATPPPNAGRPVAGASPRWLLDTVKIEVSNDADLRRSFNKSDGTLVGYELFETSPPTSSTDASEALRDAAVPGP